MDNEEYMLPEQPQKEEEIRKNIKIIKLLQSEVLKLEKEHVDLRVAHNKLVQEEKEYKNFNIGAMHEAYDSTIAEKEEIENKYNEAKNLVLKNGEETSERLNDLCDKYINMVENINNVLKPRIQDLMTKMESYNIELDNCEKRTADLIAKNDKLDSQEASLNKEIVELHAIIPQKQAELDDLKVKVDNFENDIAMKNQEFQDKLSAHKERNEVLSNRFLELKEQLEQAEAENRNCAKQLAKLESIHKKLVKWNDGSLRELNDSPSLEETKAKCKFYERKSQVIGPQIEHLKITLSTPQAADNREQPFLQMQGVIELFAKITNEREIHFQNCGESFANVMKETEYTYKKLKNAYEKLTVLHQKIQDCKHKTSKKCKKMEVDADPVKSATNRCDIEMENSEPLQKKAKCDENSPLLENREIDTKSLDEVDVSVEQLKLSDVLLQTEVSPRIQGLKF